LQDRVKDLQLKLEDKEFEIEMYTIANMVLNENDETSSETTIQAHQDEIVSEVESVSSIAHPPSLSQDDGTAQNGVRPYGETEEGLQIWADYEAIKEYEDWKAELELQRGRLEDFITDSSCDDTDQGGSQASASTFHPSPPPSYHSASTSEISEEL
jgi:hypothetical protein